MCISTKPLIEFHLVISKTRLLVHVEELSSTVLACFTLESLPCHYTGVYDWFAVTGRPECNA